eukprot:3799312-Karenia_brevis.AAC.1
MESECGLQIQPSPSVRIFQTAKTAAPEPPTYLVISDGGKPAGRFWSDTHPANFHPAIMLWSHLLRCHRAAVQ